VIPDVCTVEIILRTYPDTMRHNKQILGERSKKVSLTIEDKDGR
jgi:hypothetical protein